VTALAFDNVTIKLGGRTVLSNATFAVADGEFVGVLGPNGAGKTTLMRAALGLHAPRQGTVTVSGRPATRGNPTIGYMPQVRGSVSGLRLTGRDFVECAAGGQRWGLPVLDSTERRDVDSAIELVNAEDLAGRSVGEMSGGELQRLLLSQAILGRPKLLLLDEPLINLDPAHQRGVVELVKRVQKELGIAVLFSAHELNPLLNAIHRVLYLGGGKAVLGKVDDVITGPVLSRLYGSEIEVVRIGKRIFVMSGDAEAEGGAHLHEHGIGHSHGGHEHRNGEDAR
jgi:zinc/manganese transport system ATP-binding protein